MTVAGTRHGATLDGEHVDVAYDEHRERLDVYLRAESTDGRSRVVRLRFNSLPKGQTGPRDLRARAGQLRGREIVSFETAPQSELEEALRKKRPELET